MASNTVDDKELIDYVLSGATETLCVSLDPAKVIRRLISTHHLTDDDKREINSFPRMEERVERLLEIMKQQDKAAYEDFMKALQEFHQDLYSDIYAFEVKYHNGARPKKRVLKNPAEDPTACRDEDQKGDAKTQQDCKGHSARGNQKTHQTNTYNFGDTFNTTHNNSTTVVHSSSANFIQNSVNIHGDQTIIGGNVYNIKGDCEIQTPNVTIKKETKKP